jgi:glycosyltransferase involved in cell wall biosynthesis
VHGDDRSLVAATAAFYDEDYYGVTYDKGGVPYSREEKVWVDFMSRVSRAIVETLQPATVLDVGCAIGLLVEALRARGVDARGIDVSPWAIQQVPVRLKPYCRLGSITDEIEGHYDLITCIETLEHVPPSLAEQSIANLCRHADQVLFSSTPDDYEEPTHLNVEPGRYWAKLFLRHGFVGDSGFDAAFLAPHAMLFRRQEADAETLFESYEDALWEVGDRLQAARQELEAELASFQERIENIELRRAAENLASFEAIRRLEVEQRRLAGLLTVREWELEAVRNTKTFRYTGRLRWLYAKLRRRPPAPIGTVLPPDLPDGTYEHWVELYDVIDEPSRRHIESRVRALEPRPKISVLMPVYNPPLDMLRAAIESVRSQIYPDWELCIADDCSTDPEVSEVLAELASADPRIKVLRRDENGHIAAASNSALSLVTGQWVALLDHDDVLAEHALALFALAMADHPDAGIIYSDEDKLDEDGVRRDPYFKPDFDPLLLLGQNFLSHFSTFRKDLVDRVGGYRVGYEGSQDWDLTLRVSELLERRQVVHIPHVLYHWRVHARSTASLVSAKPYALEAGQRAVLDHLERTGRQTARLERIGLWGFNRVIWPLPQPAPKVTIVVPTKDGRLLNRCIDSVLNLTTYPNFEVVVIDNSSRAQSTLSYLQANEHRLSVIRYEHPFSHSAMNNFAVARTSSEVICLLNDDTEVINGDWLSEMIGHLSQPGVGAVGAKLLYGDGRIQHGGVILGVHGVAGHAHRNVDRLLPGYHGRLQLAQRMSAVSAACILLRREAWDEVGGLDEQSLPNVLNDVDLCLRLRDAEWDIVWTPYAELFHHESTSRGIDSEGPQAEEFERAATYMKSRWGVEGLRRDPHYSPNLSLDAEDFSLAWPPRAPYTEV